MSEFARVLVSEERIRERVRELGQAITEDYASGPPALVSVLKGSTMFLADLMREVSLPIRVEFMSISRYGRTSQSGVVRIEKDLDRDVSGEDVLIVEDIVDTGLTLSYLVSTIRSREPRSVSICTLLDRSVRRIAPLEIRYRGFECPDVFVLGYGLDSGERYRNLPYIVSVDDPQVLAEAPEALLPLLAGPAARP